MSRWEPNAAERLVGAAIELFEERGYERASVAEIAARAGVTERTFFRYFPDKREVLFFGSAMLEDELSRALSQAPQEMPPFEALAVVLDRASQFFTQERLPYSQRRQRIINAHPEFQERERKKLATIATHLSNILEQQRGVPKQTAVLVAEVGIAIFKTAFERWLEDESGQTYAQHARAAMHELRALA